MHSTIYTLFPFVTETTRFQRWFVQTMTEIDPALLPGRYAQCEPLKYKGEVDGLEKFIDLDHDVMWRPRGGRMEASWQKSEWYQKRLQISWFKMYHYTRRVPLSSMLRLFECLCQTWPVHIGAAHTGTQAEMDAAKPHLSENYNYGPDGPFGTTNFLQIRLPNLAWGMFFGKPYVELIGQDRFASVPAFRVEPWLDGYYVQVTKHLKDLHDDYEDFDRRRTLIKEHLGREFFFIPGYPLDQYRAPKFVPLAVNPAE